MPAAGRASTTTENAPSSTSATRPSPAAAAVSCICRRTERHAVEARPGAWTTTSARFATSAGMTSRTHAVTTTRVRRFRSATRAAAARRPARDEAGQDRLHPAEQVGHAGQVAEDEVTVEPDHRQQLLKDLEMAEKGDDQQRLVPGGEVGAGDPHDKDRVE